jgi:hypothetical protein
MYTDLINPFEVVPNSKIKLPVGRNINAHFSQTQSRKSISAKMRERRENRAEIVMKRTICQRDTSINLTKDELQQ